MDKLEIESALRLNLEDFRKLSSEQRASVEINKNMLHSPVVFASDYAFRCASCEEAAPHLNPYGILKSKDPEVPTADGIFPVKQGAEPQYFSELNHVKGRYVCDHCRDSCFEED